MNILIIDNGTIRLDDLKNLLRDYSINTIPFEYLKDVDESIYDIIILSGSSTYPIWGNENRYKKEIHLIKNSKKPIIGICLGFELVAYAYGAELILQEPKRRGIYEITVTTKHKVFGKLKNFKVFESHMFIINRVPKNFIELAKGGNSVEAIKHKSKPIFALQFHPEAFVNKTEGDEIFRNIINFLK